MKGLEIATTRDVCYALFEAGVIPDPETIGRVVIDLKPGDIARIYVETVAEKGKLSVALVGGLRVEVPA